MLPQQTRLMTPYGISVQEREGRNGYKRASAQSLGCKGELLFHAIKVNKGELLFPADELGSKLWAFDGQGAGSGRPDAFT